MAIYEMWYINKYTGEIWAIETIDPNGAEFRKYLHNKKKNSGFYRPRHYKDCFKFLKVVIKIKEI